MSIFEAAILGIVQGFTEFLPISSSGHLILIPRLLNFSEQPLVFDTTLHFGTALALIIFFWKDLLGILKSAYTDLVVYNFNYKAYSKNTWMGLFICLAIIPADIIGFLYGDYIENSFRSVNHVALFSIVGTVFLFVAQKFFSKPSSTSLTPVRSLGVGLFQLLSFLPGFSRSGSTIGGGMILGLNKEDAARFSFLLSVPITIQAALFQLFKDPGEIADIGLLPVVVGFLFSLVSGLWCIKFLLNYLKTRSLNIFIYYRLALVIALILYFNF